MSTWAFVEPGCLARFEMSRSLLAAWRDAVRDSGLDRTAKLVAFVISTYMDSIGKAFPSKATIAAGSSLGAGRRAVDRAVDRLEASGLLKIRRSRGRVSFRYFASVPTSHDDARLFAGNLAKRDDQHRTDAPATSRQRATEGAKCAESPRCDAASTKRAASLPEEECETCGLRRPLVGPDFHLCAECFSRREIA
jgi:hypothetical protein